MKNPWKSFTYFFLLCFLVITGLFLSSYGQKIILKEKMDSLSKNIKADSTEIRKLKDEAARTIYLLQRGSTGKDTVYFMDKDKNRYLIQFIKK